jgi:hypothetical protein
MVYGVFLNPERERRGLLALLAGFLFAAIYLSLSGAPAESAFSSGDFPAFYSAGLIVRSEPVRLYDLATQEATHRSFSGRDGFLAYAYPPWVALFFALLVPLGFSLAKMLFVSLMLVASVCAARVYSKTLTAALAFVLFPPLIHANISAQNSALSLLLVVLIIRELENDRRAAVLGLLNGLLFFKPQFGLLCAIFILLREQKRSYLLVLAGVLTLQYLLSALYLGLMWPLEYLRFAAEFARLDWSVNGGQMVSLPSLLPGFRLEVGIMLFALSAYALRSSKPALLGVLLVICSPHLLYYDLALAIPSAAAFFKGARLRAIWIVSFVVTLFFIATKPLLPGQVLIVLPLFILLAREGRFRVP